MWVIFSHMALIILIGCAFWKNHSRFNFCPIKLVFFKIDHSSIYFWKNTIQNEINIIFSWASRAVKSICRDVGGPRFESRQHSFSVAKKKEYGIVSTRGEKELPRALFCTKFCAQIWQRQFQVRWLAYLHCNWVGDQFTCV